MLFLASLLIYPYFVDITNIYKLDMVYFYFCTDYSDLLFLL